MALAIKSFESRIEEIVRRRCELDAQEAEWIELVGEYDRSHDWQADGFLTAVASLRNHCRMNHSTASAAVRLAKRLEQLPATAAAFRAGEISRQHATMIADAYTPKRAEALGEAEATFAEASKSLNTDDLRDLIKYTVDALDGDGGAGKDSEEHAQNQLHVSPLAERVVIKGDLDKEAGEIVATAVDAMAHKMFPNKDDRKPSARRADALVEICRRSLGDDHKPHRRTRRGLTHLSAIVDLQILQQEHPEVVADVRAEVEHFGRLSQSTLQRLACDCELTRIITDGPSVVLDVGYATRTVSDAQWKALVARDKRCTHPGCTLPPAFCEAHHIWYWSLGGPTDLANLRMLCWAHHRQLHAHDHQPRPG